MITRFASLSGRALVAAIFLLAMTACGGGGGGGDSFYGGDNDTTTYYLALTLLDADGNPTNTVTSASPSTLQVKVTKNGKNGAAIADVVVTAVTTAALISPSTGTALTNASGIATFRVEADVTKGAGNIDVSVEGPSGTVTASISFQVGASGLRLGYLDADGDFIENQIGIEPDSLLAAQAVAQLSLVILDENGDLASSAETVAFSSGCIASGQAILDPVSPIISGDGKVSTSYQAAGCSGNDQITASLEGSTSQAFGTVSVASPQANGFIFVSAVPTTIVLRGTGDGTTDRSESSTVSFTVVDSNNAPVGGIKVNFSLTTYVGGLSLSSDSAVSASNGLVKVNVTAGDIPTVVRVIATATAGDGSGQTVSTVSDILTVTTGLPDQNSTSLAVGDGGFVVEDGFTMNGITRTITVTMADKFNNPVTNGTAAVFTTEYGTIDPSCQTGVSNGERLGGVPEQGACSVLWTSGNPRFPTLTGDEFIKTIFSPDYSCPAHNGSSGPCPADLGYTRGGRSTILMTAIGEESFIDRNGNGVMDEEEQDLFSNLTEAFLDNNEDGIFNPATATCMGAGADSSQCIAGQEEIFVDFNDNGLYDLNDDPAEYNGLLCPVEGDGVWCSRTLLNVRAQAVLILSQPTNWYIALYSGRNQVFSTSYNGGVYSAYISDIYNNMPPAGSTVTLKANGDCKVVGPTSFTVPSTTAYGAFAIELATGGEASDTPSSDNSLEITIDPQSSAPYTKTFGCVPMPAPVDPNDPGSPVPG